MKIIKNEKKIKLNSQIGGWASLGSVLVLGVGMYVTFTYPSNTNLTYYSLAAFIVGFILVQIGLYLFNQYGGTPRPDEKIDSALKGLPGDYSIYHSVTPALHLLTGPSGIWVLLFYRQRKVLITYKRNRWHITGGGFFQVYMRIFGQEGIGRPDLEAEAETHSIHKLLTKKLEDTEIPNIQTILVFMNDDVDIQAEEAPIPAIKLKQLKDFMRQKAKEKPLGPTQLAAIKSALPE